MEVRAEQPAVHGQRFGAGVFAEHLGTRDERDESDRGRQCGGEDLRDLYLELDRDSLAGGLWAGFGAGGWDAVERFGSDQQLEAVGQVERAHGPGVLPEAAAIARRLLGAGHEVVVVSNSITAKL